jgi:hypothetical protein
MKKCWEVFGRPDGHSPKEWKDLRAKMQAERRKLGCHRDQVEQLQLGLYYVQAAINYLEKPCMKYQWLWEMMESSDPS